MKLSKQSPQPLAMEITGTDTMVQIRYNQPVPGFELSPSAAENYANAILRTARAVRERKAANTPEAKFATQFDLDSLKIK